jgi:hypothetical protein
MSGSLDFGGVGQEAEADLASATPGALLGGRVSGAPAWNLPMHEGHFRRRPSPSGGMVSTSLQCGHWVVVSIASAITPRTINNKTGRATTASPP